MAEQEQRNAPAGIEVKQLAILISSAGAVYVVTNAYVKGLNVVTKSAKTRV